MSLALGDFILELVKASAGDNHYLGHNFIAKLRIICEKPVKAVLMNLDDFAAAGGTMR